MEISRDEMLRVLKWLGEAINYTNFKNRIADLPDQKDRLSQYHEIWATMRRIKEPSLPPAGPSKLRPGRYGQEIGGVESAEPAVIIKQNVDALLKYLPIFSQKHYEPGTCNVKEGDLRSLVL